MGDDVARCRECKSELAEGAIRCAACGVRQVRWWQTTWGVIAVLFVVAVAAVAWIVWQREQTEKEAERDVACLVDPADC